MCDLNFFSQNIMVPISSCQTKYYDQWFELVFHFFQTSNFKYRQKWTHIQGVLKRADQSNPPLNPLYFGVFLMFCACLTIQYGRFFILVLLGHIIEKICWKIATSKRLNFRVCSIWQFSEIYFFLVFCP